MVARAFQKTRERLPVPVTSAHIGVSDRGAIHPINPWEGFYSDVMVKVRNTSAQRTFTLYKAGSTNEVLDTAVILDSGVLRAIIQEGADVSLVFVEADVPGVTFDYSFYLTRHRVTGEI